MINMIITSPILYFDVARTALTLAPHKPCCYDAVLLRVRCKSRQFSAGIALIPAWPGWVSRKIGFAHSKGSLKLLRERPVPRWDLSPQLVSLQTGFFPALLLLLGTRTQNCTQCWIGISLICCSSWCLCTYSCPSE